MYIIDNLTGNNHYAEIEKLASISDELVIVSPFCFDDFCDFFDRIVSKSNIKSIKLITTLRDDEVISKITSILSFNKESAKHNVNGRIFINNSLHGKVYLFKNNSINTHVIITSANITYKGLNKNHEWGYCFSNTTEINNLEKSILRTIEYELSDGIINQIKDRIDAWKSKNPDYKPPKSPKIETVDIILSETHKINIPKSINIFLKPVGTKEDPIIKRDFSDEAKQYFAKRPKAIHKDDILISYAVGRKNIVSAFRVLSNQPIKREADRWPWYVEVENITPHYGKCWFEKHLHITNIKNTYLGLTNNSPITNKGGITYGSLSRGGDKLCLDKDYALYILSVVLNEEKNIYENKI